MGLLVGSSAVDLANIIEVFPAMVYMSDSSRIERPQVMTRWGTEARVEFGQTNFVSPATASYDETY